MRAIRMLVPRLEIGVRDAEAESAGGHLAAPEAQREIGGEVLSEQLQLGVTMYDRWRDLDARVEAALRSDLLDEKDKEILRVVARHKGAALAIRSGVIAEEAGMQPGELTRRKITSAIETFVMLYRIPIGGLREPPYGYFLIASAADLELAIKPLWGEVYAHLRRLRALMSPKAVARLYGQAMLKLDKENPKEAA